MRTVIVVALLLLPPTARAWVVCGNEKPHCREIPTDGTKLFDGNVIVYLTPTQDGGLAVWSPPSMPPPRVETWKGPGAVRSENDVDGASPWYVGPGTTAFVKGFAGSPQAIVAPAKTTDGLNLEDALETLQQYGERLAPRP